MASLVYNRFANNLNVPASSALSWTTDVIKMSFHLAAYVPAKTDDTSTGATNEISSTASTDYATGGVTITSPTVTQDDVNDYVMLDAADVSIGNATSTGIRIGVVRMARAAGSSDLCFAYDFGTDQTVSAGTFTVQFTTDGLLQFQST
jgi:hypothetical protein